MSTWQPAVALTSEQALKAVETDYNKVNVTIQYYDEFGRLKQTLSKQASPTAKDMIQHIEYDSQGRELKKYSPYTYTSDLGLFRTAAEAEQQAFYTTPPPHVAPDQYPYAKTLTDDSPLNQIKEQGAPGNYWQLNGSGVTGSGHTIRYDYDKNNELALTDPASRRVAYYSVDIDNNGIPSLTAGTSSFTEGHLFVKILRDVNWVSTDERAGTIEEYTDKNGHLVAKRNFNKNNGGTLEILTTYYVYDDYGNLCFVLPPGALPDNGNVSQTTLNKWCYQYQYDEKKRQVAKRLPGKDWEFIIYNKLDQPVASQDGNQRLKNEWSFTKYDSQGRIIITGIWNNSNTAIDPASLQTSINQQSYSWENSTSTGIGYTANAWPQTITTYNSINYYDNYTIPGLPSGFAYQADALFPDNIKTSVTRGLLTATKTWQAGNGTVELWTVMYYDLKGQPIQVQSSNHIGGKDIFNKEYNFKGLVAKNQQQHTSSSESVSILNRYEFDHQGRVIKTYQKTGSGIEVLLVQFEYNELGQLVDKKLHQKNGQTKFIQSVDYRYNNCGWLTSVNAPDLSNDNAFNTDNASTSDTDKFGLELKYDQASSPTYNGNIGSMQWQSAKPSGYSSTPRLSYNFKYDKLNRLIESKSLMGLLSGQNISSATAISLPQSPNTTYITNPGESVNIISGESVTLLPGTTLKAGSSVVIKAGSDKSFNEFLSYDAQGNISTLERWSKLQAGITQIDNLNYVYDGNRHTRIDDNSNNNTYGFAEAVKQDNEYDYDANGNVIKDLNKGISQITYNDYNLPLTITWTNGKTLTYDYDRTGNKLQKVFTNGSNITTTNYTGNIVYEQGQLAFIANSEGKIRKIGSNYIYQYDLKDHLGNTRVTIQPDATETLAEIVQETSYYPFGLVMKTDDAGTLVNYVSGTKNLNLFNGKELQEENSLDMYDYGARLYDAASSRWNAVDAMAESYTGLSPYNYAVNNPVSFVDPDGNQAYNVNAAIARGYDQMFHQWHVLNGDFGQYAQFKEYKMLSDRQYAHNMQKSFQRALIATYGGQYNNSGPSDNGALRKIGNVITNVALALTPLGAVKAGVEAAYYGDYKTAALNIGSLYLAAGAIRLGGIGGRAEAVEGGTTVLGHYPAYTELASELGARNFQIPTNVWNKMSAAEQWTANTKFLDRMILRGDDIRLATPLNQVKPGSFYQQELGYLFGKGYNVSSNGLWLVK